MPSLNITLFKQQHEADCLAACAQMVLTYWEINVRYRRILRLLQVDTDEAGASFYQLAALEPLGVNVEIGDGHMELLEMHLGNSLPIIASVDTRELDYWDGLWRFHAVVISGVDENLVYIHDPAFVQAPQIVKRTAFESAWLEREYVYASLQVR